MNLLRFVGLFCFLSFTSIRSWSQHQWQSTWVTIQKNGVLKYTPDSLGNTMPDFSRVGYKQNKGPLPNVPVIKVIEPVSDNAQQVIQAAIDEVAQLPLAKNGFRGTILLKKGIYKIPGSLRITASGIVLRGEGVDTKLVAAGQGQRNLIIVNGNGNLTETAGTRKPISDPYVPVGATSFTIENTNGLKVGDSIIVYRPGVQKWIEDIKMNQIEARDGTRQWKPTEYELQYERVITKIVKNKIYIDNPVVMAMDKQYGGGEVYRYSYNGRIWNNGVENLVCESEYNGDEDEDHAWTAIFFNKAVNGWITKVIARHFGYACAHIGNQARNITVSDCQFLQPISKITGSRRYSFCVDGQLNLVMHCFASEGRHDYVTGAKVCGPNVFYDCKAEKTHADIGPHHRWSTGTLYDNIITDGEINVQDRGNWGSGHGWAGVNQVLWNCTVKRAAIQGPWASAQNYVIGLKGDKFEGRLKGRPDAIWEGQNKPGLTPSSLYLAQLAAHTK